ncbi:MAG: flagellar hook-basal body complex protein [Acetobacteraceae bacterium]|nr:flagellar hook-basal body complex protein [Acetobacteraceae bacterium]
MQNITSIALSRLTAQQRALDVTAGNIANANTPGYRAERLVFSDFLMRARGPDVPRGAEILTFTQDRASYRDQTPGPVTNTANPLDLALAGDGFFMVQTPTGPRLTRAGHFELNATGNVVNSDGHALLDTAGRPIRLAAADTQITITADGTISTENGRVARIAVVRPADPLRMKPEGGQRFLAEGTPLPVAEPRMIQGAIEQSNVAPVLELTRMMRELREFEFTSKMVQTDATRQQNAIDKLTQKRI